MANRILTLAIIISFNSQCQTDENEKYLRDFRKHFDILNKYKHWDLTIEDESNGSTNLHVRTIHKDTLVAIALLKYTVDNVEHFEIEEVKKIFNRDKDLIDLQSYDQNLTLRYWYRFEKKYEEKMVFVVGKYNYLYLNGGLSKQQDIYFESHKDSLIRVKGDNLPPLPR